MNVKNCDSNSRVSVEIDRKSNLAMRRKEIPELCCHRLVSCLFAWGGSFSYFSAVSEEEGGEEASLRRNSFVAERYTTPSMRRRFSWDKT